MTENMPLLDISMLPADGRFGSGPSKIRDAQLEFLADTGSQLMGTSHRQKPIKDLVGEIQDGIRTLYNLPDDYEVVLGNGGATAFWDIACACLIERKAAFATYGSFSEKFANSAKNCPFLDEPVIYSADFGNYCLPSASSDIDTYAWTHNETSTGVLAPVHRIEGANDDALMIVDGTSAAGGTKINPCEIDVYYFSPQKAFGSDGGLWIALASARAIERAQRIESYALSHPEQGRWIPSFLSFTHAVTNSRKHQTLNTPAIATLIMLKNQIDWLMKNGGLDWAQARCAQSAEVIYQWAQNVEYAEPFVSKKSARSTVVVTVDLDESISAQEVISALRANGIVDVAGYRALGRNQLRIGVFPSVDTQDVIALTQCIDAIVTALKDENNALN
ncbi:phosphoserine transaminase [Alloscardovia theropitheci]|uniref:phosphoserine transaminase n=1 Tax=Alloscardovia theropitheci TaxID=2496842 RepID=A0A4R0QXC5_9BIFI|nr:phosphoserine transaminase [Alloscardovia theropitheci]TCD54071.1 phosphoserine transaminase [Alloscardovia theropitheci]